MGEWRLYGPLIDAWAKRGFHTASQVTDPAGSRWEVDVVAFTPEMDDVRITEAKTRPTYALVEQCLDRLAMAPRVHAAVPRRHGPRMVEIVDDAGAPELGVLAVADEGVEVLQEAQATDAYREPGQAHVLERALRATLV